MDGYYIAAAVCFAFALLLSIPRILVLLGRREPASTAEPGESLTDRQERLDAEAAAYITRATRPASSNRKAGRAGATR